MDYAISTIEPEPPTVLLTPRSYYLNSEVVLISGFQNLVSDWLASYFERSAAREGTVVGFLVF